MLQKMQQKIREEGETEKELYDKFMCYCEKSIASMKKSVADSEAKLPADGSGLQGLKSELAQAKAKLAQLFIDRDAAKAAIIKATQIRQKEAGAFGKERAELAANIAAITRAISALEKGLTGFLQTSTAVVLKQAVLADENMEDADRNDVLAFLSGEQSSPGTSQIIGILKQMKEDMSKSLAGISGDEQGAIDSFLKLVAAKKKELAALLVQIQPTRVLISELGLKIAQMEADQTDAERQAIEAAKLLKELEQNCAEKTAEHEANQKLRNEELLALAETIKILNDDDALDLFKKTLPSASSSFVQLKLNERSVRKAALAKLEEVLSRSGKGHRDLNFIALAIMGKKISMEKVISMIDAMVAELQKEQTVDDHKEEFCEAQISETEDKVAVAKKSITDLETSIDAKESDMSTLISDISTLETQIKDLDESMAEATKQRKADHSALLELLASDAAAKKLLGLAKNRMNKFYNPVLASSASAAASLVHISTHNKAAVLPPPPETAAAYSTKSSQGAVVINMLDMLIKDLTKEMLEAKVEEKDAQAQYETTIEDAQEQRELYSKQLVEKTRAKAELESGLLADRQGHKQASLALAAAGKYLMSIHADCDWLLKYADQRKAARTSEITALQNAKAVLAGAD